MLGVEKMKVQHLDARTLLNSDLFDAEDNDSDEYSPQSPTDLPDGNSSPTLQDGQKTRNRKKNVVIDSEDDDSSDEDEVEDKEEEAIVTKSKSAKSQKVQHLDARTLLNSDLFDAEDNDSDEYSPQSPTTDLPDGNSSPTLQDGQKTRNRKKNAVIDSEDDDSSDEDEVEDKEEEAIVTKSKSAKSQKSSIAQSRGRRVKKDDVTKIHSESQRIIRDSDISLPYYKPKPLSLNDFFSKKPSHAGIMSSVKSLKRSSKRQQISCLTQQQAINQSPNLVASTTVVPKQSPIAQSTSPTTEIPTEQCSPILNLMDMDVTSSPDARSPGPEINKPQDEDCSEMDCELQLRLEDSSDDKEDESDALVDDTAKDKVEDDVGEEGDEKHDEGRTALTPEKLEGGGDELEQINTNKTEENKLEETEESCRESEEGSVPQEPEDDTSTCLDHLEKNGSSPTHETVSIQSETPVSAQTSSQPHRLKLLEGSLPQLKKLTPRLSGNAANSFIDLDDDDDDDDDDQVEFATPCNPGISSLMKRFVKHTAKSTPRRRKEVKLSVVSKETGADGKEDLKLDTIAVSIEGQEDEDPSLKIPGAKLLKLKEALQVKMRARREVERQRRKEAYRLDNEDFAQDEGEMTDQSDTDDEEDIGGGDKKPKLKKSPFVNREAAVDDDDDDDYEPGAENDDDDSERDSVEDDEESDDEEGVHNEDENPSKVDIFSDLTDNEEEENTKILASKNSKKRKKLVLDDDDDDDEEEEDELAKMKEDKVQEEESMKTLELHLDADDEEDGNDNHNLDESSEGIHPLTKTPTNESDMRNNKKPPHRASMDTLILDSESGHGNTSDSSDVVKLYESVIRRSNSSKKDLLHEEKTRDLFESTSNTDGGTTGSSELDRTTDSTLGRTSFNWSAVKTKQATPSEDSGHDFLKPLDTSSNSMDTSYEMLGSMIPGRQPGGGVRKLDRRVSVEDRKDVFTPFSRHQSLLNGISKSSSKLSELTLPVEDSQDLFRMDSPSLSVAMDTQQGADTQSFRFSYDDDETQTQFLDENGFLKLRSTSKPKPGLKKLFGEENTSQDQLDELLGLCTGKFTDESSSKIRKGLFSELGSQPVADTQGNMDELLGLCSGVFAGQKDATQKIAQVNDNETENQSESSFHILSDTEGNRGDDDNIPVLSDGEERKPKKRKRIRMMEERDSEDEFEDAGDEVEQEEGGFDSEDELSFMVKQEANQNKKMFTGKLHQDKNKSKNKSKVSRAFFENEAELSGSEYGSDEDYDADDLPDELELGEADKENVGTEDQLREQVNKVHMKTMDDDDARRLRIYKEMYLPDGDLYSDNKGRTRQFRWRNLDGDSEMNTFPVNSDDEDGEGENDEDTQWRMERYKREQWLHEQKTVEKPKGEATNDNDSDEEESSQFDIFMKTAVNKKKKETKREDTIGEEPTKKDTETRITSPKPVKFRHGSFLKRSKGDLAKIASMMKPLTSNPTSSRGSRSVLFQSIPTPADEDEDQKPQLRRSTSESPASQAPKAKKPRLDRSQSLRKPSSIFSLM